VKKELKVDSKKRFLSPSKGELSVTQTIDEIAHFVDEQSDDFYRLIIGTDSQTRRNGGKPETDFVTAIVIYRKGRGARYFWRKERHNDIPRLRDKIYTETLMSLDFAQIIVPKIRKRISPAKYDLEIHIDVGPLGPTREMIREVVGMVNGNGYVAKTKPESWGASSVADKYA
jgi:predicted RNase H-related nuclease YkuK (DUF458 family)